MPGFIDTHHHLFETALRSFLADGILIDDGRPENARNYYDTILGQLSGVYRPQAVFINELYIITDGEIRRESYSNRFATALDGVDLDNPGTALDRSGHPNPVPRITGPIRRRHAVEV